MNSYTFNKIAGWVLFAVLIILGVKYIQNNAGGHGDEHQKAGYEIETPKEAPKAAGGDTAPAETVSFASLLGKASAKTGAKVFKKCKACHTVGKGEPHKIGPNLYNLVNRKIGGVDGFAYSDAMKAKGGTWDYSALEAFLRKPSKAISGTKMAFGGVRKDTALADLIVYLRSHADTPAELPK